MNLTPFAGPMLVKCYGLDAIPLQAKLIEYLVWIGPLAATAVVATKGKLQIAVLQLDVILEYRAAKSQVGIDMHQVIVRSTDLQ